jgi:hypothetical protein
MNQLVSDMTSAMKIYRLGLSLVVLLSGTISALSQAENNFARKIEGIVVDKEGQPIGDARVCAWPTGAMAGRLPCGESKHDGHFAIDVYRPNTYTITAENIEQGYPEAVWGFYGKRFADFPRVNVTDAITVPHVTVKLGPKAGRVIFRILDETNKPLEKGSIIVCRVAEPLSCWSKSTAFPGGKYELLTPEVPFTVKFETWEAVCWVKRTAFDESGIPVEVLQVDLGERKEITVWLR